MGRPPANDYRFIDFPKKSTIIKRGAIANFNSLVDEELIVKAIEKDKNDDTIATLIRKNGRRFFRFYPQVKANLSKAIVAGELKVKSISGMNAEVRP